MVTKRGIYIMVFSVLIVLLVTSSVSGSWFERIKEAITGKATQSVGLNISVGGPQITAVYNDTINISNGPNEASLTDIIVNFTVYSSSGAGNLNDSRARANITGDTTRTNSTCEKYQSSGDYSNYTCNITMWWWDGTGIWTIAAYIEDNQTNSDTNSSTDFYVGERTAFVMSPSTLTWPGISPGGTNQTSNTDPLLLNNTGNDVIANISLNSSNLRGESTSSLALWAENFSVSWDTGDSCSGAGCVECGGTGMNRDSFEELAIANLTKGNYTLNDGDTGQENLYFCLRLAGNELTTQAYSTTNETEWPWVVQIL